MLKLKSNLKSSNSYLKKKKIPMGQGQCSCLDTESTVKLSFWENLICLLNNSICCPLIDSVTIYFIQQPVNFPASLGSASRGPLTVFSGTEGCFCCIMNIPSFCLKSPVSLSSFLSTILCIPTPPFFFFLVTILYEMFPFPILLSLLFFIY